MPGEAGAAGTADNEAPGGGGEGGAGEGAVPSGASGAAAEAAGGAGGEPFVDPVQASQADTDAAGTDADGNGVRDDLQSYAANLANDVSERALLVSWAREETRLLMLGADPGSTVSDVRQQAQRSMSVHRCVVDTLGAARSREALTELQSALVNNQLRWTAWLAAEKKLRGSIWQPLACDQALVKP